MYMNQKYKIHSMWIHVESWLQQHSNLSSLRKLFITFYDYKSKIRNMFIKNKTQIESYTQDAIIKHEDKIVFFKTVVSQPRTTGAIFPSSKHLANEMASHVLKQNNGIVLELGAGTGVVTDAILQSGIKPEDMIVIEYSHDLVELLRNRFPNIKIIEGTAEHLSTLLLGEERKINTIISSLPLRSLPLAVSQAILDEIQHILPAGGRYIQFTYSFKRDRFSSRANFERCVSKRIWKNLPPARVDVWVKR